MRGKLNVRKTASVLIALSPILNLYTLAQLKVGFGDCALALVVLTSLFTSLSPSKARKIINLRRCHFIKYFSVFFIISCIHLVLGTTPFSADFMEKWIRLVVYVYILDILMQNELDFHIICKTGLWAATLASIILIIQVIFNSLFNIVIYPYLTFLPLTGFNYYAPEHYSLIASLSRTNRYCSIFIEPAQFAQYALLPLAYALFEGEWPFKDRKRAVAIITITAAIVLSQSANGILIGAMVWVYFLYRAYKEKITVKKVLTFFLIIIVFVVFLSTTDYFDRAFERVETISVMDNATTGNQRLLQGLTVYLRLHPIERIIGIGFGNTSTYLIKNRIITVFNSVLGNEYMNGFSVPLVSGGIIGLIWYLAIWYKLFRENRTVCKRMIFFVISVLYCTSGLFFQVTSVYYLAAVRSKEYSHVMVEGRKEE